MIDRPWRAAVFRVDHDNPGLGRQTVSPPIGHVVRRVEFSHQLMSVASKSYSILSWLRNWKTHKKSINFKLILQANRRKVFFFYLFDVSNLFVYGETVCYLPVPSRSDARPTFLRVCSSKILHWWWNSLILAMVKHFAWVVGVWRMPWRWSVEVQSTVNNLCRFIFETTDQNLIHFFNRQLLIN